MIVPMAGLLTAAQIAGMQATTVSSFDKSGTRRRFPLVADRYSNQTRDTAHPSDLAISALMLFQETGTENRIGRDEQLSDWVAKVPHGTDITGRDQLIVEGKTYEVIGPPDEFETHLRLQLRYVEG